MQLEDYMAEDAVGLAALVARGEVTPKELLTAAVARAEAVNPKINAITVWDLEAAEAQLAEGLPQGPFTGVPFLLKDLFAFLAGTRLTNGSRLFEGFVCASDNTYVARCKAAGLVIFGKTNSPEFGLNATTEPLANGPTRNPWNLAHSAGGSSGGAAAAVAAGILPMAHATDGGGSIRIPASSCGLVGLKPSRGRTPAGPVVGEGWNGLAIGHVVSRSLRDTAAMLDATHGPEAGDPYGCPAPERPFLEELKQAPGRLRIALASQPFAPAEVDPECHAAAAAAARLCESLGHAVEEVTLPIDGDAMRDATATVIFANMASDLEAMAGMLGRPADSTTVERATLAYAAMAAERSAKDMARAIQVLQMTGRQLGQFFERYDVLLSPTLPAPPPELGHLDQDHEDPELFTARVMAHIPYTPLYNNTGCPAITLPLAWSETGLPIGVMFGSRLGGEGLLLRLSAQIEEAQPWADRRPTL